MQSGACTHARAAAVCTLGGGTFALSDLAGDGALAARDNAEPTDAERRALHSPWVGVLRRASTYVHESVWVPTADAYVCTACSKIWIACACGSERMLEQP
jgi:hypothetical protein